MFNFNHLYYFYSVAKLGGVMEASRALRVAQPSISAQLKSLEASLGRQLFHKVGRRLQLTPEGERVFGFCRGMFEAAEELADYLKDSESRVQKRTRIGVTSEIERPFMADSLTAVMRQSKGTPLPLLSMVSGEHANLIERLRSRELDAVVTNHPVYQSDAAVLEEISMPVMAVASAELLRAAGLEGKGNTAKLLRESGLGLVLPSDKLKIRIETDLYVQKVKLKARVVFESDMLAAVVRAAVDGAGLAFLPYSYIASELKQGRLRCVGETRGLWRHSLYLIGREEKKEDAVVAGLRRHFGSLRLGLAKSSL